MSTPTAEERAHNIADMAAVGGYRPDAYEFKASVLAEIRAAVEAEREKHTVGWKAWLWDQRKILTETSYSNEKKEGYRLALRHLEETLAIRARSEGP